MSGLWGIGGECEKGVREGKGKGLRRESWNLEDVRVEVEKVNDYCQNLQDIHFLGVVLP